MASEIRVNKLNSQTGVGTITLSPTGVDISGITTAATLKATTGIVTTLTATTGIVTTLTANTTKITTGIVTTLTATTGIVTTLTTNTLTANSTAKVGSGVTLSPDGDVFVTGVTTSSTVKVGAAVTISESGIEASGIGITCASINGTQIGGRRNLIINGAMQVAQRGTSASTSGYKTVDRFYLNTDGVDEEPTQAQVDVSSGTTPYAEGFRKAYKITNGNQTGGAGAADNIIIQYYLEAQDIANSGWNYTSSSSFLTLSFYVKTSVAQNYFGRLMAIDGTQYNYPFETGSLTANTWTKITKTIPGNSNLQFDNDVNRGLSVEFCIFRGTNKTGSVTLDTWAAYSSSTRVPDMTSTWYTTNDATFEITGVQLEVGPQATAFEHRSFHEERELCRRYYHAIIGKMGSWGSAVAYSTSDAQGWYSIHPEMRAAPTFTWTGTLKLEDGASGKTTSNTTASTTMGTHGFSWWTGGFSGLTDNYVYYVYESGQTGYFQLDAEL